MANKIRFSKMMFVYYIMAIISIFSSNYTNDPILGGIRIIIGLCLFIAGMLIGKGCY